MTRADEIQAKILGALKHGPLTLDELSEEIDEAPFHVEAYLKDMRRKALVELSNWISPLGTWRLTSAGDAAAALIHQMRF